MDNASKALIIAGAVLIAVMLVSIGVMIYQQAAGVIDTSGRNIDALNASLYNSTFEQYVGKALSKASALKLVDEIIYNNNNSEDHFISVQDHAKVSGEQMARNDTTEPNPEAGQNKADGVRKAINASKNVKFYAKSGKDSYGFIDSILIIPIGGKGGTYTIATN